MFERIEVVEIAATGGTAFGIEVDVRDQESVEANMAQVVAEWGKSMSWLGTLAARRLTPFLRTLTI
jgi:hypothetical protein